MKRTTIYCLTDPYTFEIKYVGKTIHDLEKRLTQHCLCINHSNGSMQHWINELKKDNKKPIINKLEVVYNCQALSTERKWIKYYDKKGIYLLNLINY